MTSADLLLHPVRLRIVQAFLGDVALTTSALAAQLADIPSATLYRHVARLADAGVLQVVAERQVRGAVERTYVLRAGASVITPDQIATMTVDDMRQAFMAFVAGLLGDVDRYLARDEVDPIRDGASFRLAGLWLDDTEYAALLAELTRVLQPAAANPPRPGRKRRILATVLLPGEQADGDHPDNDPTSTTGRTAPERATSKQATPKHANSKRRTS
ncbi:helix-turn-helix domain-containing protein [Sphaerisporangium sp. NPDC051017]|uniref:helix-turn-helix domain-containing protein n=1 Tax=Sphaerisporangium sp. NPDC051017 TaxID=3154636 RepID=UPI00341C2C2B